VSQLAVDFKQSGSGREQRTDGNWKHLGIIDGGSVRIGQPMAPRSGQGVEVGHYPGPAVTQGYILSYDRDLNTFRDLTIQGKNVSIYAQAGGSLNLSASQLILPDGSITTPMLAPNAVQQLLTSSYLAGGSGAYSTINTWLETSVQIAATVFSGAVVRLECRLNFSVSAAAAVNVGIFYDHALLIGNQAAVYTPSDLINWGQMVSFVYYYTPSAGTHTFGIGVNFSAGTLTLSPGAYQALYVTEQKR